MFDKYINENGEYFGVAKVSSIFANRLIPKTEFSEFDIFKEDGSQKKFKELFKLNNLNDSYYLLLTNGNDERGFTLEQFEKLHNYIISALHTMLSFEEYLPEIIKNR